MYDRYSYTNTDDDESSANNNKNDDNKISMNNETAQERTNEDVEKKLKRDKTYIHDESKITPPDDTCAISNKDIYITYTIQKRNLAAIPNLKLHNNTLLLEIVKIHQ